MGKIKIKPKSKLGKWSIGIILLSPILILLVDKVPQLRGDLLDLAGIVYGCAFFCGIIGIVRKKDYSVLVFIFTLIGLFVLLFYLKVLLFPTWRIIDMR
jgi:hypothetical protein